MMRGDNVRSWCRWLLIALLCGSASLAGGCLSTPTPEAASAAPTRTTAAVAAVTATPAVTPSATVSASAAPRTLTLWITELVSPLEGGARSRVFEQQIAAFEATHPGLTVQVLHKKAEGKGGMQDFLTGASAVAPAAVPDLIALDTRYLTDLARKGLIVPLDPFLSPSLLGDLYPFALRACTVDGQLVGVQFDQRFRPDVEGELRRLAGASGRNL